jgi:hypothetical protein
MFSKIAIVSLFAGLVAGQAKPVGNPSGNPITRPVNEVCTSVKTPRETRCCGNAMHAPWNVENQTLTTTPDCPRL